MEGTLRSDCLCTPSRFAASQRYALGQTVFCDPPLTLSSCNLLLAPRGVVPDTDAINDRVLSPTESRRYADIHVLRNFLATKVIRNYGPFTQSRIDDLIQLRNR